MREEIANLVFPVLRQGTNLLKRLRSRRADSLDFIKEQKNILGLLQDVPKSREALADYLGDNTFSTEAHLVSQRGGRADAYLGIRYALACWIDDIMIQPDLPWQQQWSPNSIELQLFGTRLRAEWFWKQAERAQVRPSRDPLEVYYLCVMLGFRGEYIENPDRVAAWRDQVESQLTEENAWSPPPEKKVTPFVPDLVGAARKQHMVFWLTAASLTLILTAFLVISMNAG